MMHDAVTGNRIRTLKNDNALIVRCVTVRYCDVFCKQGHLVAQDMLCPLGPRTTGCNCPTCGRFYPWSRLILNNIRRTKVQSSRLPRLSADFSALTGYSEVSFPPLNIAEDPEPPPEGYNEQ